MLLEKLIRKQQELGMSDRRFAKELGVSRALWQFTKTGQNQIGIKMLSGIRRRFPELMPDILIFLDTEASKPAKVASLSTAVRAFAD